MLAFVFESIVFLGFSYGFYFFFLRRSRSFTFIRFFFLATLLFAGIIPFIEIDLVRSLPLLGSVSDSGFYTLVLVNGEMIQASSGFAFSLKSMISLLYFTGLGLMLLRFLLNLIRLSHKTKKGTRLKGEDGRIILTEVNSLPYSFFGNIYMNRNMYERGEEVDKLLLHEGAHCMQIHSADVLFAEFLKAFLWFNPFVWLITNAIRLNHEYLADEIVLESQSQDAYQLLLINLELANQTIYLASDFNYSLTKKRLTMMNNKHTGKKSTFIKIASLPLFLLLAFILTFCEAEQKLVVNPLSTEVHTNHWWRPILAKHEITPSAYNNFEYIFEMGSANSIDENNVVTLSDALFVIRTEEETYAILRSPSATHNLESGIISGTDGILETYDFYQSDLEPIGKLEMKNFKYQLARNEHEVRADYLILYERGKHVLKGRTINFEARDSLVIITD